MLIKAVSAWVWALAGKDWHANESGNLPGQAFMLCIALTDACFNHRAVISRYRYQDIIRYPLQIKSGR